MRTEIILTAGQTATIEPLLRPGLVVIGKVMREPFDGTNAATSGRLTIELGPVPEVALPKLREAIRRAQEPRVGKSPPV